MRQLFNILALLTVCISVGCTSTGDHGHDYWVPPPMEIETAHHLPSQRIDGCPLPDAGYDTAAGCHRSARSGYLHDAEAIHGETNACTVPAAALQAQFIPPTIAGALPHVPVSGSKELVPESSVGTKGDGSLRCGIYFTLKQGIS